MLDKKHQFLYIFIYAIAGIILFRLILFFVLGSKGMTYFGIPFETMCLFGGALFGGFQEATEGTVRYRYKRDLHQSVKYCLKISLLLAVSLGAIFALLLFGGSGFFAEKVFGVTLCEMAFRVQAFSYIFIFLIAVLRGYAKGLNLRTVVTHNTVVISASMILFGILFSKILINYGNKVSNLLKNPDVTLAYGAIGASIGILLAFIISFLHILGMVLLTTRNMLTNTYDIKKSESTMHLLQILAGSVLFFAALFFVVRGNTVSDVIIYHLFNGDIPDFDIAWGNYYGINIFLVEIFCLIMVGVNISDILLITVNEEREERRGQRERLATMIHRVILTTTPLSCFLIALAPQVIAVFSTGDNEGEIASLQFGGVMLFFMVFSYVFGLLLMFLKKSRMILVLGAVSYLIHDILLFLLVTSSVEKINIIMTVNIIYYLLIMVAEFIIVSRFFQYKQEWIRQICIPVISSAVSALLMMLLAKALSNICLPMINILICLLFGTMIYLVALLAVRGFSEEELSDSMIGRFILSIGRLLNFYS